MGRRSKPVRAVDGVSFTVHRGEVVAVVGESGCGKSTLGRLAIRLLEPSAGRVMFDGVDVTHLHGQALRAVRLGAQIVFQDPFGSLNPRMTVGASVAYPLKVNGVHRGDRRARDRHVGELLQRVGLNEAHARRLPHELSGGQRQRVGIARAIAVNPKLLVLDEPVAALDLSAQARVLNLFKALQRDLHMAYLFITHDLSVAHYMADRIVVMYAGRILEVGDRATLFERPSHPYTEALLAAAMLQAKPGSAVAAALEGDPPSPTQPPPGCRFAPRCPHAQALCEQREPALLPVHDRHMVACHITTGEVTRRAK